MQCPEIFAIYLLLLTSLSKHVSRKTQTHIYESFPPEFLLPPTLQHTSYIQSAPAMAAAVQIDISTKCTSPRSIMEPDSAIKRNKEINP